MTYCILNQTLLLFFNTHRDAHVYILSHSIVVDDIGRCRTGYVSVTRNDSVAHKVTVFSGRPKTEDSRDGI